MKKMFFTNILLAIVSFVSAQGCSDAGFCTAGNFNAIQTTRATTKVFNKNEIDFSFNYGTHNKGNEIFLQPQINYRRIKSNEAFVEIRLPFNNAKDKINNISTTGIGDITATYNNQFAIDHKNKIDYSIGLRVSLNSAAKMRNSVDSYAMFLQTGLGTTDLIAVANYKFIKYLSIGTGFQFPLIQYNQNKKEFSATIIGDGYRRKPDALLKLTGHYQANKFKINAGLLSIFHLANDYYNTSSGKFILQDSKGTTINFTADCNYAFCDRWKFSLLYAEPLQTRKNIPDGLARSRIIVPKITYAF